MAGALLPIEKKFSVTVGGAGCVRDAKQGKGFVDPRRRPFKLGEGADGGFVEDEMARYFGTDGLRPFSTILLVGEDGHVAKLGEDVGERGRVRNAGLGLY